MSMGDLHTRLSRIESDISEVRDETLENKEKLIEHNVRFQNGIKVMAELKKDVQDLQPKAPDWQKIFLAGCTVVGILMGAQIYLQDRFEDRPTKEQVDNRIDQIRDQQRETAKEISDIEKHQNSQESSIRNIEKVQEQQEKKLDIILNRLPPTRK